MTKEYIPANFIAGQFPVVIGSGKAAVDIAKGDLVTETDSGGIAVAESSTLANVVGVAAVSVTKDAPVVFLETGEIFATAINLPADITISTAKNQLRKLNIYLK